MIGIYQDSFIEMLKKHLSEPIKITTKNIICRCPWCEMDKDTGHFHCWISKDAPIFNCFRCGEVSPAKGSIKKLIKKITGTDDAKEYVDKAKLEEMKHARITTEKQALQKRELTFPEITEEQFPQKAEYFRSRFGYHDIKMSTVPRLVYDLSKFLEINKIPMDSVLNANFQFFQNNFIGFVTENHTTLILRNIDEKSNFRYYKFKISYAKFLDYYKLIGPSPESTHIILGEGIFDIYSDYIFDFTGLKKDVAFYASANSNKYMSLLNSVIFNEQIFRPNIHIISDRGIELDFFKRIAYYSRATLESMTVYYNKLGDDFNDLPCEVEKIPISIT